MNIVIKKKVPVVAIGNSIDKSIKEVSIDSIILWKDNPRKNKSAIPKLANILKVHGQISPIVVWKKNNVVYKGNTTLEALRSIGSKTVKVLFADFVNEAAAVAFGIADNKSSEFAEWDDLLLENLMTSDLIGFPESIGFSDAELKKFKERISPDGFKSFDENIDTEHECPKCHYKWSGEK